VLITKTDLLPYLPVQVERIEDHIKQVNPHCAVLRVSASSGAGIEAWHLWLHQQVIAQRSALQATPAPQPGSAAAPLSLAR
jgi:hydrogenase nickel incorporation protein HypB